MATSKSHAEPSAGRTSLPPPQTTSAPAMSPAAPASKEPDTAGRRPGGFALPKLRLEIRDLAHPGARRFLDAVDALECVTTALAGLLPLLYTCPDDPGTTVPPIRSVTLILRDMPGVAHTTASDLDNDHKEIHFSLAYVAHIPAARAPAEIAGVITHELVHCYQYNGLGTCPGGLIEGVADWVRLRCGLVPPHWKRDADGDWDAGYQKTAFFLDYLERRFGPNLVQRVNDKLRVQEYQEAAFWDELTKSSVVELWSDYGDSFNGGKSAPCGCDRARDLSGNPEPTVPQTNGK